MVLSKTHLSPLRCLNGMGAVVFNAGCNHAIDKHLMQGGVVP